MNLQEQIRLDMVNAMKTKDSERLSLLRVVAGEFSRVGKELSDEQVLKVLKKLVENANEMGNISEINILEKYLPKMLGDDEVKIIISNIINENGFSGIKDMGKVMGELKKLDVASQIDGKKSSTFVKEMLS